jgi:hypothetical protein
VDRTKLRTCQLLDGTGGYVSYLVCVNEVFEGEEIRIPSSILENTEDLAFAFR